MYFKINTGVFDDFGKQNVIGFDIIHINSSFEAGFFCKMLMKIKNNVLCT